MIKQSKKIDYSKAMAAAKRSADFWSTIDGSKLAKVGRSEKDMDIVGPEASLKKKNLTRLG
ncbi:hypothetical protein QMS86_06355 [Cronobacter dublinensis]|uniref:hypothetical protein n=1 Tax=Cronobacter dublinensis TaxID=413497 RepID=UPI0013761A6E|nr:hypothetical protein [Cronobacter dublinensis]EKY3090824.1 hypothetical protein [Cronobacter dublinensis]ELQ6229900.1 hypothetical protein [Cronobacter dublinensis]ELY4007760.1 hypothetical protein [Cronobacter dublinensis]ELY4410759.1 hypothetical protein [Cronobacter dublinensis]ELY5821229.1 hypothetical protein [Cronobacter dublinensis]